jgi:CubicO group peptidase (beta-lactamase class C family)
MFTAMAALKLRDQGRLGLGDPISRFIERCPDSWRGITVEHLMRHTSGIPDYEARLELGSEKYMAFMSRPGATGEILEQARKDTLEFAPGSKFSYSNTGYIVLSYVIERAAGVPFADFVRRTLLDPAGMKDSGVLGTGRVPRGLAAGYTHGDLGWEKTLAGVPLTDGHLQRVPALPLTPPHGDAWLYSTLDDLHRWSVLMDGSTLVSKEEAAEVFTAGAGGYGFGWFVDQGFGRRRHRHNGFLPGYATDFIRFPDDSLTIVLFSNLDRARMSRIARDLSAIVLGQPYDMPVRGRLSARPDAAQAARLEGAYLLAQGDTLRVRNEPDYLTAQVRGRYTAGLIPLSAVEFYMPLTDGRVTFTLEGDAPAATVNLRYSGEDHLGTRIAPR